MPRVRFQTNMKLFDYTIMFYLDLHVIFFQREEHEKRIKSLRKELDWIASSQWMYTPVDKLIGQ